jgi:hypothetical protein
MKLSKWKVVALTVGAAALVVAVISPAFGVSSLKKLVKKEVTKQLANKTGPAGPPGLPGAPGKPGVNDVTLVRTTLNVAANNTDSDWADCPGTQIATGGGVGWDGGGSNGDMDRVADSAPSTKAHDLSNPPTTTGSVPDAWYGNLATEGVAHDGYVWVACVPSS